MTTETNCRTLEQRKMFMFEKRVETTLFKYDMISPNDTVMVALSGGADSVCLLLSLKALSQRHGFALCACHLNHGIRGYEADCDEEFSRRLCEKNGIPFHSEKVNVPEIQKNSHGSLETVARNERYSFFERASKVLGANKTATAHTMSDNAETVVFNICRGTSPDGICGIPPVRESFIRPLIESSRQQIEDYLCNAGQDYVTDSTNSDEHYTRNFLRHSIIPQLKKLNPEVEQSIFRLSDSARLDKEMFGDMLDDLLQKKLTVFEIYSLPPAMQHRYIRELYNLQFDKTEFISHTKVSAIAQAVEDICKNGGIKRISVIGNIFAVITSDGVDFTSIVPQTDSVSYNIPLNKGQNIINEEYAIYVAENTETIPDVIKNQEIIYRLYIKTEIVSDIIKKDAFIRDRQQGDVFRLGGISRNLKKVFSDKKIPRSKRHLIPLVCCENAVAALPLFNAPADEFKPQNGKDKTIIAFYKAFLSSGKE